MLYDGLNLCHEGCHNLFWCKVLFLAIEIYFEKEIISFELTRAWTVP